LAEYRVRVEHVQKYNTFLHWGREGCEDRGWWYFGAVGGLRSLLTVSTGVAKGYVPYTDSIAGKVLGDGFGIEGK
jgi:hypothetical protein